MAEMKDYISKNEPSLGDYITHYAEEIASEANSDGKMRMALFNGTPCIAFPGDTGNEVERRWQRLFAEHGESQSRTPQARENAAKWAAEQAETRKKAEALIHEMEFARLWDIDVAIGFVERSSILGYTYTLDLAAIYVQYLKDAGYEPNANCGKSGPEAGITLGEAAIYPDGKCRGSAGSHLHGQIMEWGVTHWMPLPEAPE